MKQNYLFKPTVKELTVMGLLTAGVIALTIVSNFTMTTTFRFLPSFSFVFALALCGKFGPVYGGFLLALTDIISYIVYPGGGPFFPGYTLTALLTGIVFGLFLYTASLNYFKIIVSGILVFIFLNTGLNSYWIYMLYGKSTLAGIPHRLLTQAICLIVFILISKRILNFIKLNK